MKVLNLLIALTFQISLLASGGDGGGGPNTFDPNGRWTIGSDNNVNIILPGVVIEPYSPWQTDSNIKINIGDISSYQTNDGMIEYIDDSITIDMKNAALKFLLNYNAGNVDNIETFDGELIQMIHADPVSKPSPTKAIDLSDYFKDLD